MKRKVRDGADLMSKLPESILHHILSFLPAEDSVLTSVLSKQWNSAWKSCPILKFQLPSHLREGPFWIPQIEEALYLYMDFVDRSLRHLVQNKLRIERLSLHVTLIEKSSVRLVDTWLPLALHNGVSRVHFGVGYNLLYDLEGEWDEFDFWYYPLPQTTFELDSSLLGGFYKYFRLEVLTLCMAVVSENIVRDIIRNCPNLVELFLCNIRGLETVNISEPGKLERLHISISEFHNDINSVFIDALSLKHISLDFGFISADVQIFCRNLKKLELIEVDVTEEMFHLNMSRSPLLEILHVSHSWSLRKISISLKRLKRLELIDCRWMERIEIDAPNLSSFKFKPHGANLPLLVSAKIITCSAFFDYNMHMLDRFDSFWFLRIREYLSVPFEGIIFYLSSEPFRLKIDPSKLTFDPYDLREAVIPPLEKVDLLDLTTVKFTHSSNWVTLLDGLLWSCRPKTVLLATTADSMDEDNCIMTLCGMLNQSECQLCCRLPHCNCWRLRLSDWKMSCNGLSNLPSSCPADCQAEFSFDWDRSAIQEQAGI